MGVVEEIGPSVKDLKVGDRVVIPFNVSCKECCMCNQGLQSQCETTQVHEQGMGASLFGFTKLYGQAPGGQAEFLRVPFADKLPIKVPDGPPDDRFLFLSDVLPTAWQGVEYAGVPDDGTLVVLGLGPIGSMASRIAHHHRGHRVIGVDLVPERLERVRERGIEVVDLSEHEDDLADAIREMTDGRGPESVLDAGIDKLSALYSAIEIVRRGGRISLSGVYGGTADPLPMLQLFDKQIQLRMGQANVLHWVGDILPLLTDEDPLGVDDFATHHVLLTDAAAMSQKKEDGAENRVSLLRSGIATGSPVR